MKKDDAVEIQSIDDLDRLKDLFHRYKEKENKYQDLRRVIEDRILELCPVEPNCGPKKIEFEDWTLVISPRTNNAVDYEKLKGIIKARNLDAEILPLFRFGVTLKKKEWKESPPGIKRILAPAITTVSTRPYFKLEEKSK